MTDDRWLLGNWADLSLSEKEQLSQQAPVLVLGPREISANRVAQLTRQLAGNLTKKTIVWGCLAEDYICRLENSPQFRTMEYDELEKGLLELELAMGQRVRVIKYAQEEVVELLEEAAWSAVIGINGSWHRAFHYRDEYQIIKRKKIPHKLVSAFVDELEAKYYERKIKQELGNFSAKDGEKFDEAGFFELVDEAAHRSFDHTWQTGAVLAKNNQFLLAAHNRVVPFETYALLHGASKEKHLSPVQDLNYYDTNHAEVEILLQAIEKGLSLAGCSLYINLMPCPICARMLTRTGIKEVVYRDDHTGGHAAEVLGAVGIAVREYRI